MGIEEGTFWDEPWMLYGNQFDNKLHILKKKKKKSELGAGLYSKCVENHWRILSRC